MKICPSAISRSPLKLQGKKIKNKKSEDKTSKGSHRQSSKFHPNTTKPHFFLSFDSAHIQKSNPKPALGRKRAAADVQASTVWGSVGMGQGAGTWAGLCAMQLPKGRAAWYAAHAPVL